METKVGAKSWQKNQSGLESLTWYNPPKDYQLDPDVQTCLLKGWEPIYCDHCKALIVTSYKLVWGRPIFDGVVHSICWSKVRLLK